MSSKTIKLTQHSPSLDSIQKTLAEFPSVSWFSSNAVEGISTFTEAVNSGRIKKELYSKIEDEGVTCWRCDGLIAHPINEGMAAKYKAGAKFNDHWECKGKHNKTPLMCAACDLLADRVYHPNFKLNALYTKDEAFQLTLDDDLISFLIDPPVPPFLFVMGENNSQHMAWVGDYTLDSDLLSIQKSRDRYLVSRKYALSIAHDYKEMLNAANAIRKEQGATVDLATPLESGRREINNKTANNMQLSQSIYSASSAKENDSPELIEMKASLQNKIAATEEKFITYGDWYVASMFLKALLTDFESKPSAEWQKLIKKTK